MNSSELPGIMEYYATEKQTARSLRNNDMDFQDITNTHVTCLFLQKEGQKRKTRN